MKFGSLKRNRVLAKGTFEFGTFGSTSFMCDHLLALPTKAKDILC
jgi:hypothetical protein